MSDRPPDYRAVRLVHVTLRAELGRAKLRLKDIEGLGPGTVVTLDRLAGEPVELRCMGQVIARGEVVIQDDSFAIRVTQIVERRENIAANAPRRGQPRPK